MSAIADIDASRIAHGLWQGAKPPQGSALAMAGFHVVVLCAQEHQPKSSLFQRVSVVHCPMDDTDRFPDAREWKDAQRAASIVCNITQRGGNALVSCMQGRNRSGLVSALALHLMTGRNGAWCAECVRANRKNALTNDFFRSWLGAIPGT